MKTILKRTVAVTASLALVGTALAGITGPWRGELDLGQMKLPLVFNFSENASGEALCTLSSPAQGAKDIPATVSFISADSVSVQCNAIGAKYEGRIGEGTITGTFMQAGHSLPLNLAPEQSLEQRRPQTPKPPFPYTIKDTTFTAPDGAVMCATLTLPPEAAQRKVPAVIMVTGSGAQNRDEELFEHKPFAVIADYLARHGIASLRYDDRGTGKSGGVFLNGTTYTFKDDSKSALRFLRSLPMIGKAGVLGHSEGGTIAMMLGAEKVPDFIVSLAGMMVSGRETLLRQNGRALSAAGLTEAEKENSLRIMGMLLDEIGKQYKTGISEEIDVYSIVEASGLQVPQKIVEAFRQTQKVRTPWFDAFVVLDPTRDIKKVKCPVIAFNGDKDTQVYPDNLEVLKKLLPKAEVCLMPGLNHLLQHAETGEASEYGEIRETISPEVLEAIAAFILRQ
ncbi:MAG: alpha/beta fold hydrolase [Porphyromonadaceae bacterium]|nr:alpha/beta fold hydrolase [Porphyromonadaceae bacterium]